MYVKNVSIEECIFCQKYKKIIKPLPVGSIKLPKEFEDEMEKTRKQIDDMMEEGMKKYT